jgi:hypothetical protein
MYYLKEKRGACLIGMGGDIRLFKTIPEAIARKSITASVKKYVPDIHHLEGLEYLSDIGFTISSIERGNAIQVSLDTIWNAPMSEIMNTVLSGDHYPNKDHREEFIIRFKYRSSVDSGLMDMDLIFDVTFIVNGQEYKPSEWRRA